MTDDKRDNLQRLLDYNLGLDDASGRRQTERRLAEDAELSRLNEVLEGSLAPLGSWADEEAPAGLAERTLALVAQRGSTEKALAAMAARQPGSGADRSGSRTRWVLSNLRDLVAVAACLALVFMVWQPGVRQARQRAQQVECAAQLRMTGQGLAEYSGDHGGSLPYVAQKPNTAWWYVAGPDQQSGSNTRNVYMLVRGGYRPVDAFGCPAVRRERRVRISPEMLKQMQDFASRDDVNYSFRLMVDQLGRRLDGSADTPVMTDQNPLFDPAHFDSSRQSELDLAGNSFLLKSNSPNHRRRGQNVLYNSGAVQFIDNRFMGPGQDDIFTIQSTTRYRGTERPKSANDVFIAP